MGQNFPYIYRYCNSFSTIHNTFYNGFYNNSYSAYTVSTNLSDAKTLTGAVSHMGLTIRSSIGTALRTERTEPTPPDAATFSISRA